MSVKQKGNVITIILLILILASVLGFGGWYVYSQNRVSDNAATVTDDIESTEADVADMEEQKPVSDTGSTKTHQDPVWHYSFDYPKDWRIESKDGDTTIFSPDHKNVTNGISPEKIETGATIKVSMHERRLYSSTLEELTYKDVAGYIDSQNISIATYDGIEVNRISEVNAFTASYFLYRTKSYVAVTYSYNHGEKQNNVNVYDTVRNSLQIVP